MRAETIPTTFRADEVAAASGLQRSSFDLLLKYDLTPEPKAKRRGAARLYDINDLGFFALTGALFSAGAEVVPAARVAKVLSREVAEGWGTSHVPDGLEVHALRLRKVEGDPTRDLPMSDKGETDRFALYLALRKHLTDFEPTSPWRFDALGEIVDRRYVFESQLDGLKTFSPFSGEAREFSVVCRIDGWARGSKEVTVSSIADELPGIGPRRDEQAIEVWKAAGRLIEQEFDRAREGAVGLLRINLSLAVRRAYEVIALMREGKGA